MTAAPADPGEGFVLNRCILNERSQSACTFAPIPRSSTSRRSSTLRRIVCCNNDENNFISECVMRVRLSRLKKKERKRERCWTHFSLNSISMPTTVIDPWAIKFVDSETLWKFSWILRLAFSNAWTLQVLEHYLMLTTSIFLIPVFLDLARS